jgi:hypothetical protein
VTRGATWLWTDLYAAVRVEVNAFVAAGQAAQAVARVVRAEVLHVDGSVGWTPVTDDMLKEVDEKESDDFADFDDDEDALGVTYLQWSLLASFKIAPCARVASAGGARGGRVGGCGGGSSSRVGRQKHNSEGWAEAEAARVLVVGNATLEDAARRVH